MFLKQVKKLPRRCSRGVHVHHHLCPQCYISLNIFSDRIPVYSNNHIYIFAWSRLSLLKHLVNKYIKKI